MEKAAISGVTRDLLREHEGFLEFFGAYERRAPAAVADLVAGNPQEMPLPEFVETIRRWTTPENKDWFAYKQSVPEAVRAVVDSLARRRGVRFDPADVFMTTGAFGALVVSLQVLCDPGDEVVYLSPPWFFYRGMIQQAGAVPVRVPVARPSWDIDVEAVDRALTAKTRAIIVNSPNNPSGRIYPRATLDRLAKVLEAASRRSGRHVFLVSDESYSRILFDGRRFESPTESYPLSLLIYTYGKQLLAPGERIGYLALPPTMPLEQRLALRDGVLMTQILGGWLWPNAVPQYALPELEDLSIDLAKLQRRRDRVVKALRDAGYDLHTPEGTFYLLVLSPWPDAKAFVEHLAARGVLVLPGHTYEMPDTFRISLTGSDEMFDRALPVFASAIRETARA